MEPSLASLVERLSPELIVASGDLTHRGRPEQHDRAAAFLRGFGLPLHVIPGNHDIPYTFPARFTQTWRQFERCWETTQPVYRSDTLFVVGLNSVRAWRQQSGGIRSHQLEWASAQLDAAPAGALQGRHAPPPPARRAVALAQEARCPAQPCARVARRRRRRADPGRSHPPGRDQRAARVRGLARRRALGDRVDRSRARPAATARQGEARGLHVYDFDDRSLRVQTYVWRDDDWGLTAVRRFGRGREPLAVES